MRLCGSRSLVHAISQDAGYALRIMRRSPGFTVLVVASLALGIGVNTAIFSLMNVVMLRLLPVEHPEELVELLQKYPGEPRGNSYWTTKSYLHFREHARVFSSLIGTSIDNLVRLRSGNGTPELAVGEYVTTDYFQMLGVKPAIGRLIGPEDDAAASAVAVLSWSCWRNRFNRDSEILGKRIFVQNEPVTVIGVAPRAFAGLRIEAATDVWLPRKPSSQMGLTLLGRLKPGATISQARAEMSVLYRFTIEERSAGSNDPLVRQLRVEVEHAGNGLSTVRDRFGRPLFILIVVAGLLLLIACVNIASLLLARGAGREREMAVRAGLGASRSRLLGQVLTESLMLSILGTIAGTFAAYFGTVTLTRILGSGRPHEQVHLRVQPDLHVLLFATGIAIATGLLFGLAPACSAIAATPASALGQRGGTGETRWKRLFGKSLVSVQVGLSLVLLSTGAVFVAHLWNLEHANLGFRRDHVLLVTLDPSSSDYRDPRLATEYQELLNRLKRIHGVRSASLCAPTPLSGAGASGFAKAEGFEERPSERRWIAISRIAPEYFSTIGSPVLAGRDFNLQDQKNSRVAIINQRMALHYFANRNPIGRHVTLEHVTGDPEPKTYEIVGVAGDANYLDIRERPMSAVYLPAFHDGMVNAHNFALRTDVNPENVAASVRTAVREVTKTVPVARITTLSEQIDASIVPERLVGMLPGFFGALGATLAGVGIYGLLAYTVARRTNEIGIRMALGATARNVQLMVIRDTATVVGAGLAIGVPLAITGRSFASRLVQDVVKEPSLPVVAAVMLLVAGAIVASYVPARRAARVDPIEALRHE